MNTREINEIKNNDNLKIERVVSEIRKRTRGLSSDFSEISESIANWAVFSSPVIQGNISVEEDEEATAEDSERIDSFKAAYFKNAQDFALKNNNIPLSDDIRQLSGVHTENSDDFLLIKSENLSNEDISVIQDFLNNPNISVNFQNFQNLQISCGFQSKEGVASYKSINVSSDISQILEEAYKKGKPVRIDFENGSSVVLKVGKDGKISAEFVSSDKAMENAIKNSIPHLKSKFDFEGVEYGDIYYKNQNKKQKNRKKEG